MIALIVLITLFFVLLSISSLLVTDDVQDLVILEHYDLPTLVDHRNP